MGQIPEFAAYSIADGLKRAFTRFGKWTRTFGKTNAIDASATNAPMLPGFAELFELDYGQTLINAKPRNTLLKMHFTLYLSG